MSGLIECFNRIVQKDKLACVKVKALHSNVPLLQFNDIYANLFLQLPGDFLGVKIGLKLL